MESRQPEAKDNDYLPVLVIGQIGSGKSTLINYLLGKKISRVKRHGRFRMDVAEGDARPVIYHTSLFSGTTVLGEFKDDVKKISYYDTPPLKLPKDDDNDSSDAPKADHVMSQISNLIDQVKEKKGVVIVVVAADILYSVSGQFIPTLQQLCEKTKIVGCPILFAATKIEGNNDDLTNVDAKDIAIDLLKFYRNSLAIVKNMQDADNWIAVNMLAPESCQAMYQWIEKVAPRKISTLTENQQAASESAKNPHTPKIFKPVPLVIASVEVSPYIQKQIAERSSPTNGR